MKSRPASPHPPFREHLHVLRQVVAGPGRYVRPWYLAYLLLGIVTAGMIPVLLPLMVSSFSHHVSTVAYVMGTYNLGLLTSPLWGMAAERRKLYRSLFLAGFLITGTAVASLPLLHDLSGWLPVAFALGAGSSAAATIATLLVVDFAPKTEWEPRIGVLQGFNGTGQVVGLLLAVLFSNGLFSYGLWIAAILMIPALFIAIAGLPSTSRNRPHDESRRHLHRLLDVRALARFPHLGHPAGVGFHFHHLNLHGLRRLPSVLGTPFGRFLLSWFMFALGIAGFFTYFPLMLAHSYEMPAHVSSLIYALGAAVSIALFILAGNWAERFGAGRVYEAGLWLRLGAFGLLLLPYLAPTVGRLAPAAGGFALIVLAWPILSVSATDLAARLTPFSEGAAMGLLNASLALATMIGAFLSGPLVNVFGYRAIVVMALTGLLASILLGLHLGGDGRKKPTQNGTESTD